jgi:hypothetical protein
VPLERLPWSAAANAAVRAGAEARAPGAVERVAARDDRARRDGMLRGRAPEPLRAAAPLARGGEAPLGPRYGRRPPAPAAPPPAPPPALQSYLDLPPEQLESLRAAAARKQERESAAAAAGPRAYKQLGARPAQRWPPLLL